MLAVECFCFVVVVVVIVVNKLTWKMFFFTITELFLACLLANILSSIRGQTSKISICATRSFAEHECVWLSFVRR